MAKQVVNVDFQKAAEIIRSVNHPLRQSIIKLIRNKALTVTQIYTALKMEQSVVSQHLKILRDVDVVSRQRDGKFIKYLANTERLEQINGWAKQINSKTKTKK